MAPNSPIVDKIAENWEQYRRGSNKNPYSIEADGPTDKYVDPKPYWEVDEDARFSTYQGERWTYYKFPENIDVGRRNTSNTDSQAFLNEMFQELADQLNEDTDKVINDTRRDFHISLIRDNQRHATHTAGSTTLSRDYENRMEKKMRREKFFGYFGVNHITQTAGLEEKLNIGAIWDRVMNKDKFVRSLYAHDEKIVDNIMTSARFKKIDLNTMSGEEDYSRLTAWHGVEDEDFHSSRTLSNTMSKILTHGYSVFTERWGEIEFLSLGPEDQDGILKVDPNSGMVRFADALFWPGQDVIGIWIRGQIRSNNVTNAILDSKSKSARNDLSSLKSSIAESRKGSKDASNISESEVDEAESRNFRTSSARDALGYRHPMLDNVEMLVAVRARPATRGDRVLPDSGVSLADSMKKRHKLTVRPLRSRQRAAFQSTFPGSPVRINKIPRHNRSRPELSNVMLPGILSMSGLMRNASKASPTGAVIGWENSPEMTTIRADIEDPSRHGGAPGFGVFGQTGSGKALSLCTRVMTPSGFTTVGDIKPGDMVLDMEGNPTRVVFVTDETRDRKVYRITLNDGQSFLADEEHQWVVRPKEVIPGTAEYEFQTLAEIDWKILEEVASMLPSGALGDEVNSYQLSQKFSGGSMFNTPESVEASIEFERGKSVRIRTDSYGYGVYNARIGMDAMMDRVRNVTPTEASRHHTRATTRELISGDKYLEVELPQQSTIKGDERRFIMDAKKYGFALAVAHSAVGDIEDFSDAVREQARIYGYNDPYALVEDVSQVICLEGISPVLYTGSIQDRVAFLSGYMQVLGFETNEGFALTDFDINEEENDFDAINVTALTRSLGLFTSQADNITEVKVYSNLALPFQHGWIETMPALKIVSIEEVDSVPVRCLGVEHESKTFLIGDNVVTSNTQFMLNFGVQNSYLGKRWIFMNPPKTEKTTLAPFFSHPDIGGVVIKMTQGVLETNPGMFDPFAFYANTQPLERIGAGIRLTKEEKEELRSRYKTERTSIGRMAYENISQALKLSKTTSLDDVYRNQTLRQELLDGAVNPNNACLGDVIFGNRNEDESIRTEGISNQEVTQIIQKLMKNPFWKAFISMTPITPEDSELRRAIEASDGDLGPRPILIEWDTSMQLPADGGGEMGENELDAVLNVQTTFQYAVYMVASGGQGGLITFDEAHLLANSDEIMSYLDTTNRIMREGNATIMLGSQAVSDLDLSHKGGRNLLPRLGRSVFMDMGETPSKQEWEAFSRQAGWDGDDVGEEMRYYMTHASVNKSSGGKDGIKYSSGYYRDSVLGTFAGKVMFLYPDKELYAGRTDKEGYELRANERAENARTKAAQRIY